MRQCLHVHLLRLQHYQREITHCIRPYHQPTDHRHHRRHRRRFATFPFGVLLDYAGPMYVCICACTMNALGALLYGLAFEGVISGTVVKFAVFSGIMTSVVPALTLAR